MPIPHERNFSAPSMLQTIADLRATRPDLAHYLTHPEIIVGLAEDRFGRYTLQSRLEQLADADSDCDSGRISDEQSDWETP